MITVCIFINGKPIYTRSAVNIRDERTPRANEYKVDDGTKIEHIPSKGAVKLAIEMLKTIKE